MRMAKGFKGRQHKAFGIALRKVHKACQYAYRDRRVKKRLVRREWIGQINAAVREHGISYSRFAHGLSKQSNIELDRKILADLAVNEPYSFKAVFDEVKFQANLNDMQQRRPIVQKMTALSYHQAMNKNLIWDGAEPSKEKLEEMAKIYEEPKIQMYGLRYPERDAKTDADYMRISFVEEDQAFMKEQ